MTTALPSPPYSVASAHARAYYPAHPSELSPVLAASQRLLEQPPPPTLREILHAYKLKGDGDRDMLLAMLHAKAAEDSRLAETAALQKRMLDAHPPAHALPTPAPSTTANSPLYSPGLALAPAPAPRQRRSPPTHAARAEPYPRPPVSYERHDSAGPSTTKRRPAHSASRSRSPPCTLPPLAPAHAAPYAPLSPLAHSPGAETYSYHPRAALPRPSPPAHRHERRAPSPAAPTPRLRRVSQSSSYDGEEYV